MVKARQVITEHERLRRQAGYTVTEFARALGVSHCLVSRIEGGQVCPSTRYRKICSELLGVPERFIFPDESHGGE